MIVGYGDYRYRVVEGWGLSPDDPVKYDDAPSVTVDSDDNVYVFTRSVHGVVVYDRDGAFKDAWGGESFVRAHGIRMLPDDIPWCTDDMGHTITVYSPPGSVSRVLGKDDSDPLSTLFRRPTQLSRAPNGDLYVADGYGGNAMVHRLSPDGEIIRTWGEPGTGPGQFHLPHSVWAHTDGRVFVADRENDRIQIFDADGNYLDMWTDIPRVSDIWIDNDNIVYTGELRIKAGQVSHDRIMPYSTPSKVSIRDIEGNVLSSWGAEDHFAVDGFFAAHSLCVDSHGDIYVAQNTRHLLTKENQTYLPTHPKVKKFERVR